MLRNVRASETISSLQVVKERLKQFPMWISGDYKEITTGTLGRT